MEGLLALDRAKIGGFWKTECWRPFDPVLARQIREKYSNLPWYRRLGRWLMGKKNGVESPEYKAIPRYLAWVDKAHNIWTDEGLDALLDIMFHGDTQITTWYVVMFENDFTPDGDETYAVPGYTETTAYDEATRPEYEEAASSSQSMTNSANKAQFTMNATKTLYGAALVGGGSAPTTKGNTAGGGTLACAVRFASSRGVVDDDVVNATYTLSAADDGA